MNKLLLTILAMTVSTLSFAEYSIKVPLEVAQGGTLPNGSISITKPPVVVPTFVSSETVCENSADYNASDLFTTQTRNFTRTCKDVALYSDYSTVESNETVDNLSVTGTKEHLPYFTTNLSFRMNTAHFSYGGTVKSATILNNTLINTTQHRALFKSLVIARITNTSSAIELSLNGNYSDYVNSVKDIIFTTNTGIVRTCDRIELITYSTEARLSCWIGSNLITDYQTSLTSSTTGSIQFILAD